MVFFITAASLRHLRVTPDRFPHYDALPSAVILNGDKHVLWERRKTEQ
ncbi:MAG: hypothetical protein ACLTDY_04925 [Dialister invisus]